MATITKTACKTTKIVGCTGSGRTPTITTSTSGPRAAFTAVSLHTEDDPDLCGEEEDFTAPQRRSIAGRIQLERRAKGEGPVSFGTCVVPEGFAVDFPGYPKTTNIFNINQAKSDKRTNLPLKGIARYYDRQCDAGVVMLKRRASGEVTDISQYTMDHSCEPFFANVTKYSSTADFIQRISSSCWTSSRP